MENSSSCRKIQVNWLDQNTVQSIRTNLLDRFDKKNKENADLCVLNQRYNSFCLTHEKLWTGELFITTRSYKGHVSLVFNLLTTNMVGAYLNPGRRGCFHQFFLLSENMIYMHCMESLIYHLNQAVVKEWSDFCCN